MSLVTAGAVVLGLLGYTAFGRGRMTYQLAPSGKTYRVKQAPGQELVAERLDILSTKLHAFLDAAEDAYPGDRRIVNVRARWTGTLSETERSDDIAYSLNKRDVHVCIRSDLDTIETMNTCMYVLLHEIAHVATDSLGHEPEFWRNFRWFLEVAEKLGVYTYEDFDVKQTTFCGHTLGNNVLSCVKRKRCESLLTTA